MHDRRMNENVGNLWVASRPMGLGRALQKAGYGTRKIAESVVMSIDPCIANVRFHRGSLENAKKERRSAWS